MINIFKRFASSRYNLICFKCICSKINSGNDNSRKCNVILNFANKSENYVEC